MCGNRLAWALNWPLKYPVRFIDCTAVRGPPSFTFKSLGFVFFFLFGPGLFPVSGSPAATARQNRAPPRSILPPTRPGGGPGRGGLSHSPGGGVRDVCQRVRARGGRCAFPLSPPSAPVPVDAPRGEAERAVSLSAGGRCEGAEREGRSAPSALPHGPALPHRPPQLPSPAGPSPPGCPSPPASAPRARLCRQPSLPRIPRAMSFRQRSPHGSTKSR